MFYCLNYMDRIWTSNHPYCKTIDIALRRMWFLSMPNYLPSKRKQMFKLESKGLKFGTNNYLLSLSLSFRKWEKIDRHYNKFLGSFSWSFREFLASSIFLRLRLICLVGDLDSNLRFLAFFHSFTLTIFIPM